MGNGTHTPQDVKLIEHEIFESKFFNTDYNTAHEAANKAGYASGIEGLTDNKLEKMYYAFLHRFGQNRRK